MPKGPRGERRPADVIGNAVHVMRIATGEVEDVNRVGWKLLTIVFAITLAMAPVMWVLGLPVLASAPYWSIWVFEIAACIGVAGYSWQLPIGRPSIWKVVFVVDLLLHLGNAVWVAIAGLVPWRPDATEPLGLNAGAVAGFILGLVRAYALFQYGFRESALWMGAGTARRRESN